MNPLVPLLSLLAPDYCLSCHEPGSVLCLGCSDILWFPPSCFVCGRLNEGSLTCDTCRQKTPLASVIFSSDYAELSKDLVRTMKFRPSRIAARDISRVLAAPPCTGTVTVTYVPTPPSRIRERGFDHAGLIARLYARQHKLPLKKLLNRDHDGRQVGADKATRKEQMKDAFSVSVHVLPKNVILIDDVVTTGATIESAARTLKKAGIKNIHAVVFARTV